MNSQKHIRHHPVPGNEPEINVRKRQGADNEKKNEWDALEAALAHTAAKVRLGKISPLAYYMQKNLIDKATLAKKAGLRKWQVTLHLYPAFFRRVGSQTLQRYAAIFNISPEEFTGKNHILH